MKLLTLHETQELKVLLQQAKGLEKTISEILNQPSTGPNDNLGKYTSYKQMAVLYNELAERMTSYVMQFVY